jgi:hypothetical protein
MIMPHRNQYKTAMMSTTRDIFPTTLETLETTRTIVAGIVPPTQTDTLVLDPGGTEGNRRLLVADGSTISDSR